MLPWINSWSRNFSRSYRDIFINTMGLSRPLFGFISLLVHWLQLMDWHTIIDNEDRKQERRIEVSLIVWSKTSLIEKAQRPARMETVCVKSHGRPGIRTRPARIETCCSTACATTAAQGNGLAVSVVWSRSRGSGFDAWLSVWEPSI